MQRISSLLASQVLVILFVGSHAWPRQIADDSDLMKRTYSIASQYKRPMYDFGLGKRSWDDAASEEDLAYPSALDGYTEDKRAAPNSMYSFGLGKRNRAYGFGLGKRLEAAWKYPNSVSANRQERRSKIYSFGLGKRSSAFSGADDYYDMSGADKRAPSANRQFSFGLGKRDVSEASHMNTTS